TRFFDRITRASVTWRWVTIFLTFAVLAAGGYSYTQINQELVPPVEFPQTILVAQWPDSESTEQFLTEITQPLEQAMQAIEGVVNVESTTNKGLVFLIVRNEFGENQARLTEEIEAVAAAIDLPEGVEPEVFNFSLSDLPVVVASVSSAELSLPELKALIESELEPELLAIDMVSKVDIGGGQELPEEVVLDTDTDEAEIVAAVEEVEVVEDVVEEPNRLSGILIAGLRSYDIEVEYVEEITPAGARVIIYEGGQLSMQALGLLSDDNLRLGDPATLAYLPSDYIDTLDADLVLELEEISAEFGGVGQFTIDEALVAKEAGIDILTGRPLEDGTIADVEPISEEAVVETEPETEPAEEAVVAAVALPEAWIQGAQAQGLTLETTADLTPEFVEQIGQLAPQSFALLTDEMVLA
ncbi:MAG: efflux RND transporter permease subunit, partial [Methylococcales bacterium]|nr:efflux RND transporter permease subunit [Methylococcales bacterium]